METMSQFANEKDLLKAKVKRLEDILFARGAMEEAPCFCCGYNGPGYYQPDQHPCAKRHHKLTANGADNRLAATEQATTKRPSSASPR